MAKATPAKMTAQNSAIPTMSCVLLRKISARVAI